MHPCKSPGPHGFPALFYKKYWNLVGDEICEVVLNFLNNGAMPEGLNHTHVVFIPKTKNPSKKTNLRLLVFAMYPTSSSLKFWKTD